MTSYLSVSKGILDLRSIRDPKKQIIVKRDAPLGESF